MSNEPDFVPFPIFHHHTVGPIRGVRRPPYVDQFLGVQYATLSDRFARGELVERYPLDASGNRDGVLDATKSGPLPLSHPDACAIEQSLIQHSLPHPQYSWSDTECLTLNIATPKRHAVPNLPVLAFVHGGGFSTGSSSWPQYDLAPIVNLSLDCGMPIVAVGINYRLGAPGFLSSSAMRDAGYKPNNGLDDQRLALRWIKQHITGFGGDPDRVTFVGESAGAAAGFLHLQSPERLFHQLVSMGGTSLLRPIPAEVAEMAFGMVVGALGAEGRSPADQVRALLDAPADEFATKIQPGTPIMPIIDDDTLHAVTTYEALRDWDAVLKLFPAIEHCKSIVIGDCQFDGFIFTAIALAARADSLTQTLERCLSAALGPDSSPTVSALLSAYGINTSATSNSPEVIKPVLDFGNDISFAQPARAFAQAWSSSPVSDTKSFLYHFNVPNPWDGPWKGHATHILDIAFLFQNYNAFLSPGQRSCAQRFAKDVIAYVNGIKPWVPYGEGPTPAAMVYDAPINGEHDQSGFLPNGESQWTGRRDLLHSLAGERNFDKLVDAWQMFMAGPPPV